MRFLARLFAKRPHHQPIHSDAPTPHHVLITLTDPEGDRKEQNRALATRLIAAAADAGFATLDPKPRAEPDRETSIIIQGPNADAIFDAIAPIIEPEPIARESRLIKVFGDPTDPAARTETIDLHWEG